MKGILALSLSLLIFLTACSPNFEEHLNTGKNEDVNSNHPSESDPVMEYSEDDFEYKEDFELKFENLNDPSLLQYVQDSIYADLLYEFDSEDYMIEDISLAYVSEEYLEEVAYNSQANIYFSYSLDELDEQYEGKRYVFTLSEEGQTSISEFTAYDDSYEKIIENISYGSGVILVSATVAFATGGTGLPTAVQMIFLTSAETGAKYALSQGVLSGVIAGTITGIKTGDFNEAKKSALLHGSKGFKWGAITGVIAGGVGESIKLYKPKKDIPSHKDSEKEVYERVRDTKPSWNRKNVLKEQAYLDGKPIPSRIEGSTVPDISYKLPDGSLEAYEVKNFDLKHKGAIPKLKKTLYDQVKNRIDHLPPGSKQRIVLDIRGRGYDNKFIKTVVDTIEKHLFDIYPGIPIDVMGY